MRFLTLSAALLTLGFVYAEEPSLECAMFAETCETLCVLSAGGELAVPKCAVESSTCLCDGVDMSDYVNENAIPYINSLSEGELIQFIDSSYERHTQMVMEYSAAPPSEDELSQMENPRFNLVLDGSEDDKDVSDVGDELDNQKDVDELEAEVASEGEAEPEVAPKADAKSEIEAAVDVEDDEEEEEDEDDDDEEDEEEDAIEANKASEKSTRKSLMRAQDPFCQTFVTRCKDDCPAAQSEITCALEDSNSGYMLVCACNGVDISASVYAQVKAESKAINV